MKRGFTLVEAMIIVALLGIIMAMILPRFGGISERRLEMEARRIQTDLRLTRRLAITNGVNYILKVYPLTNEYKIYRGSIADPNQVGETRTIKSEIAASGNDQFAFESAGNASAAATLVLTSGSYQYNVSVTAATGRVSIAQQ
jgi:Tfp pilus assembly protein FimT